VYATGPPFFPADVVKTKMQIDPKFAKLGLIGGLRYQLKTYGLKVGWYSGWSITACRAFPANAVIFSVFEVTSGWWDRYFN